MFEVSHSGDFKKTEKFLAAMVKGDIFSRLEPLARAGVAALAAATPVDSSETAASWDYKIAKKGKTTSIYWTNSHAGGSTPVAILLQYGHGTGTGGYVAGRNYINPAIKPIFDQIADEVWKAVTSA